MLTLIGEELDPDAYVTGVYLTDKHTRGTVSLRLEVWFSTADDVSSVGYGRALRVKGARQRDHGAGMTLLLTRSLPRRPSATTSRRSCGSAWTTSSRTCRSASRASRARSASEVMRSRAAVMAAVAVAVQRTRCPEAQSLAVPLESISATCPRGGYLHPHSPCGSGARFRSEVSPSRCKTGPRVLRVWSGRVLGHSRPRRVVVRRCCCLRASVVRYGRVRPALVRKAAAAPWTAMAALLAALSCVALVAAQQVPGGACAPRPLRVCFASVSRPRHFAGRSSHCSALSRCSAWAAHRRRPRPSDGIDSPTRVQPTQ